MRLGLTIQFESRADALEIARLIESTVWVNDAHPAHRRAAASRSEGYVRRGNCLFDSCRKAVAR
jgi:hypothetical protein